jgi:polysaccharide biosynthesis protein PslG
MPLFREGERDEGSPAAGIVPTMRRRPHKLIAAVVPAVCGMALLLFAGNAAAKPKHPRPTPPLGGVNIEGLIYGARLSSADQDIAVAKRLHARVVRTEVFWSILEPRAAEQIDPHALAFVDRLVADAAAAHIKVIATVRGTPCWDSSAPAALIGSCSPTELSGANAWPPRDPREYARIVSFIVRRYGTRLAAIEIWNEPDQSNEKYFAGPDKAARYAALLRAAYPAIKQANPRVAVLAGSLVGSNGVFLRALYAAGIKGYYDGLAIHYYTLTLASLRSIREVQLANGDSKPLWLDEFGWASCWPHERIQEEQACVTPRVQAANVASIFRALANTPWVAAEVIYQLRDSFREEFGAVNRSGAQKPVFDSLSSALISPFNVRVSPVTIRLRRHAGHVVASGSGPVGDFMGLEVFQGSTLRYRAVFTLDRFNRYSIPLPRVLGTHGLRVRVFQYWSGIGRAAQKRI